jgi:hypothetical protein
MKKPKTRRYIVEIISEAEYRSIDIEHYLRTLTGGDKLRVIKATASAIRKLGDQQT